ncbi:MAG: phosphopantothenoylcysteine decarboxylase [Lactobacillales bacterium]|jgi:phosphopantothenoylcysteine decarboxylase|nr:phosphopantothenoylcysteine decarboxylase [Lactobacillales bacterium]
MSKKVVIGVCGGIAAYKMCDVVFGLRRLGVEVEVLMTKTACSFVGPLTFRVLSGNDVRIAVVGDGLSHLEARRDADLLLIAPATANMIGKIANGIADDIVSTVAMSFSVDTPRLIAPAMNTDMYNNPAVQRNLATVASDGYEIIAPRVSLLACGDEGNGALANVDTIINTVKEKLSL